MTKLLSNEYSTEVGCIMSVSGNLTKENPQKSCFLQLKPEVSELWALHSFCSSFEIIIDHIMRALFNYAMFYIF